MNWDSSERRNFVRAHFLCKIEIAAGNNQEPLYCHTENLSAGGIRVVINKKIPTSTRLKLKIDGIGEKPIFCEGKVRWTFTRKLHKGEGEYLYDTGIEFSSIKPADVKKIKKVVASLFARKQ